MSGFLQSPNWPQPATTTQQCQWAIVLPNPEAQIKIVVEEVDIDAGISGTCFWNYVAVFDTMASVTTVPPLLRPRICGTTPPPDPLVASGNIVHIWYYTRHTDNRGFSLFFSAMV